MGIRFNTNTWRAPLQLIDSWLPAHPPRKPLALCLPQVMQRFARAGWLGRSTDVALKLVVPVPGTRQPHVPAPVRACRVRVLHGGETSHRTDGRLVISGRMSDVCAELDRLAALEQMRTVLGA